MILNTDDSQVDLTSGSLDQAKIDQQQQENTHWEFIKDISPISVIAADPIQFMEAESKIQQSASDMAGAVRSECNLGYSIPVDTINVAVLLGLRVIARHLNEDPEVSGNSDFDAAHVSGVLEKRKGDDSATIYVESSDQPERQRFTVAHEISHWKKHTDGHTPEEIRNMEFSDVRKPDADTCLSEYSADMFAQILLLPKAIMLSGLANGYSLQSMSDKAGVSTRTMENRLRQLALMGV